MPFGKTNKLILWHVIAWIGYAIFLFATNLITNPEMTFGGILIYLLPFCVTFYVVVFFLGLFKNLGVLWSIASFFIVFLIVGSMGYLYIYFVLPAFGIKVFSATALRNFVQEAILGYFRIFSFALLYFYVRRFFKKQQENILLREEKAQKEIENAVLKQNELKAQKEKLQYEYAFLRAQINPHFLHNTLNLIFSQALEYSDVLADNILKLSAIMRYSMETVEFESGKVPVQKEIDHLKTLLDINHMRFGNSKTINLIINGEANGQMVPPLSFITIVENAFKYGDLKDPLNPLTIQVDLNKGQVHFSCVNKIKKSSVNISSNNIGLTNLSKRLDISFKDKYEMNARPEGDFYIFDLIINN